MTCDCVKCARMNYDIAIVGAGTAGAAAALFLARAGHRVSLFERVANPMPVGTGILLQPTGLAILKRLDLLDEALLLGARVERLLGHNARGRLVMDMRYCDWREGSFGLGMHRGALFNLLQSRLEPAGVTCCYGRAMNAIHRTADKLLLRDESGAELGPFDLIVAADGMRSTMRKASGIPASVTPYPWGAVWAICETPAGIAPDILGQRYRAAREMIGLLPTGRLAADGAPLTSLFWSLPTAEFAAWQARGLAEWKQEVLRLWPGLESLLANFTDLDQLRLAEYCDVRMPRWHNNGVVVIGDAAHATSPQLGQGTNLALFDAFVLNEVLQQENNIDAALARYTKTRGDHLRYYQWASRMLTPLFQSRQRVLPVLRDLLMGPMGRWPGLRGHSAETLVGIKAGMVFGKVLLPEDRQIFK